MAMPLGNVPPAVRRGRLRALREHGRLGPEPHRAPLLEHAPLLLHQADHRVGGVACKFSGVGSREAGGVSGDVDHGALHPQADTEEGHPPLPRKADRLHLALNTSFAEASGHDESIEPGQQPLGPLTFDVLALDRLHSNLRPMRDAAVVERLVDALVGVSMLCVLADKGDRDLMLGVAEPVQQIVPLLQIGGPGLHPEPPQDDLVDPVGLERERNLVD